MPLGLSHSPFLVPLKSFFQDIGLHATSPRVIDNIDSHIPDPIGDIWQAEEADVAFQEGRLRSLSMGTNNSEADSSDDDNQDGIGDENPDDDSSSSSDDSDDSYKNLEVVFRNESPVTLLLCWVSELGEPHHFYRLEPSPERTVKTQTDKNAKAENVFELLDTDHKEHTFPGHAFCLGYVESEEQITQVQKTRSFNRREAKQNDIDIGTNDDNRGTHAQSIVIAGYRPYGKRSASHESTDTSVSLSSSSQMLSRRVQLITVSHDSSKRSHLRRRVVIEKRKRCLGLLPWCFKSRKRSIQDNNDYDSTSSRHDMFLDPRGWRVSAKWVQIKSKPFDTTRKIYNEENLGGWPCMLEPDWSNGDTISADKLERDIRAASSLLPPHARAYLHSHCKIWVNRSLSWGPSECPIDGNGCCYHPSKQWLICNGLSQEKHMCVEVNDAPQYRKDCDLWGNGGVMLHELSHAYHNGMLPDGYDNKEIQRCFDLAMKDGLYDSIEYHCGFGKDGKTVIKSTAKAYAATNAMEYFAELSAAFLGGLDDTKEYNKWYPFNRSQIKKHDPRAYELLLRLWKVDEDIAGKNN